MIISKTPLRVSFVGGGTDIREYYKSSFISKSKSILNKIKRIKKNGKKNSLKSQNGSGKKPKQ